MPRSHPTETSPTLQVHPLSLFLGAEVVGIDPRASLPEDVIRDIRDAWLEHGVLVFPGCEMTVSQHIAFSRNFGELELHPIPVTRHPDHPEVMVVTNRQASDGTASPTAETGRQWHSDGAYTLSPPTGSFLHCREIPSVGGDTWFTSMYAAYDGLSATMKAMLEGLSVVNNLTKQTRTVDPHQNVREEIPPVIQPLIRVHPETGRKALYLNETVTTHVSGMTPEESDGLLRFLFNHSVRPEFTYRHRWKLNDLVLWDNRCTMHLAPKDYRPDEPRYMCRTTLLGAPIGRLT
jgi:taurine dioxygenase